MNTLIALQGIHGDYLGEVFEEDGGFAFHHAPTGYTKEGYSTFDDALDAWHEFNDEWLEYSAPDSMRHEYD
jgi:hypothetical protein